MNTGWSTFTQRFWGSFRDLGTGRLPADSELKNRRYLIMATIGKGGMGAVYLAHDTQMRNKLVAIKEMSQANLPNRQALHRARQSFQQEASMLSQLQYPNLPEVYDSFQENGRSYLVMEYIQGKTLAEVLKQRWNTPLPVSTTVEYGLQLSSVLTYLHTRQPPVIYLDLKPQNIMLRDDGRVFLIDFGIARAFQPGMVLDAGEVFCTPGYAPPEQMAGQAEPRSDLFALGATLHQCLTRQNPQAHTREHLFDFPLAQPLNPLVPDKLNILVHRMLNVDQQKRPASAASVFQELEQIHRELANPVVLTAHSSTVNPFAPTIQAGLPSSRHAPTPTPSAPSTNNWARVAQLFPQLARHGQRLGFSLVAFGKNGVMPSLMTVLRKPFQQAIHIVNNQKIWDSRFATLLFAILLLASGGSLSLLKSAPDATHIHILGLLLMVVVLVIISFHLTGKRLDGHVPRAALALMGLALAISALALQGLPDIEAVVQPLIQNATLNQVCIFGLLTIAVICLLRPKNRLIWLDRLLLGALAACGALFQYNFGPDELAQWSGLSPNLLPVINASLYWGLLALAALNWLLLRRPFGGLSRFTLALVAAIFTFFQYVSGIHEFQAFHMTGQPLIILSFAYTCVPVVCALLALFTGRVWLTRAILLLLTIAEVTMLSYQGKNILFAFSPVNPYLLNTNLLDFSTFYQVLGPLLILVVLLTLTRLRSKGSFHWIDYGILLLGAWLAARLDEAFWQAQHNLAATTMDQSAVHQQYTILVGLLPAYLIYVLLGVFPLTLLARSICYFWRQAYPYAPVDPWLNRLQTIMIYTERLLALALVSIAFLLSGALGLFTALFNNTLGLHFTSHQSDLLLLITLGLLAILAILGSVLLVLLLLQLRRKVFVAGKRERLVVLCSVLVCLLLTWQHPQLANLPLITQQIQFTGNFFHWPATTLYLVLLSGLALAPCFAFFWLQRSFFDPYRDLFNLLFSLVLICAFLQIIWPIFLPLGLLCLIPGVLLVVQVEKAG